MATFTLYIHDDRYSVPSLAIVDAVDEAKAKILAANRLLDRRITLRSMFSRVSTCDSA